MVNGTLMAKGGQDQVNESVALEPAARTVAQIRGRKAVLYCDFAVLGAKPGEFPLRALYARYENRRCLAIRSRLASRPCVLAWHAVGDAKR
jgi:hypothetical protein